MRPIGMNLKMKLAHYTRLHSDKDVSRIVKLNNSHADKLAEFYQKAYPDGYFDRRLLETEKYFGWFEGGNIASVAGVHVCPPDNKVAVLGSIATDPEYRGKGLATILTSYLVNELVEEERLVCLNVRSENIPAIKCYQNIGFIAAMTFEDANFERRK